MRRRAWRAGLGSGGPTANLSQQTKLKRVATPVLILNAVKGHSSVARVPATCVHVCFHTCSCV